MNQPTQSHGGVMAWFTRNPVAANLLMIGILALGIATAFSIRTEAFPAFPAKTVTVSVPFQGGTPDEVEEGVAIKIEEALNGVAGIKEITSTIDDTGAIVQIEKQDGHPLSQLKDDVKLRVDAISTFPSQAERPVITEQQEERQVVNVEVYGEADHYTLKETARRIRDELLKLPEINKVDTSGARNYEINIELSELALRQFNMSFDEVAQAIQNNSINLSGGALRTSYGTITLRTEQQRYHGYDYGNIVLRSQPSGGVILLKDVATIRDGYEEQQVLNRFNSYPTVSLSVQLLGDDSITVAADVVKNRVEEIRNEPWLPQDVKLTTWYDDSLVIRERLGLMSKNALSGIVLVLIMLAMFLNLRVAAWVALGIPISFAGTLLLMGPGMFNYSLNVLTTFGFIVVLGIVVDDAIVIGESIYTEKEKAGPNDPSPVDTTISGAHKVAVPATFGVLTTVAAFFPLTLISSEMGKIFGTIAVVVISCLIFSLIESKWILPAHLSHLDIHKKNTGPAAKAWENFQSKIEAFLNKLIHQYYRPVLSWVLEYRYTALCIFISLFIFVVGLVPSGLVRTVFFPDIEIEIAKAELKTQKGMGAAHTDKLTRQIEEAAWKTGKEITEDYGLEQDALKYSYAYSAEDHKSAVYIEVLSGAYRDFTVQEVVNRWRENIGKLEGVEYLDVFKLGPGAETDIEIELSAEDYDVLLPATNELRAKLEEYKGVSDVKSSAEEGNLELRIALKPEGQALGLSNADVARQVRNSIYGFEAQRIQRGRDEVKVRVRYPETERNNLTDLNKIRIRTAEGGTVPIDNVAELVRGEAPVSILRVDKRRVIEVTGRSDKTVTDASEVLTDLEKGFFQELKAKYPGLQFNLDGEAAEEARAMTSLAQGFLLALTLIYTLLAIPLKSYLEPLVIMAAIPFGIIGAIIGHLVVGIDMSLLSFFGLLALSGVVVNDSLVLTSRFNDLKNLGLSFKESMMEAGTSRFRAILLTSITTFMGLVPLLTERSEQAQFLIPMAVSLAFGILFATVITLLIIPVLLGISQDIRNLFEKSQKKPTQQAAEVIDNENEDLVY